MLKKISAIVLKVILVVILVIGIFVTIFAGLSAGSFLEVMKTTPDIDAETIKHEMSQNSTIVDEDGKELETIRTAEYRELIDYDEMPDNLKNAFVAVEDERFFKHNGIDPISIAGSVLENIRFGAIVRGGSTLTQQLARNTYLSNDQKNKKKIKEIYIALQIEKSLNKEEILEAYMNRVFLGQNSFGVQAAAETYFSKNAKDLSLAECASIAGIVQSPTNYALYNTIPTSEITDQKIIGEVSIYGQKYSAVYNKAPFEREKYVLKKMKELGYISDSDYEKALSEDVASEIKPAQRNDDTKSSYFTSLLETQVVEKLEEIYNITEKQAWEKLNYGGLKITTTIDQDMQDQLEELYANFSENILGYNTQGYSSPPLLSLSYDNYGNILNRDNNLLFYAKSNILNDNNDVILTPDEAWYDDNKDIVISSDKLYIDKTYMIFRNFYSLDDENSNLRTHTTGSIKFNSNEDIFKNDDGNVVVSKSYLSDHEDFISQDESGNFLFNKNYYDIDLEGVIQPQASTVVIDQDTGQVKAIMGGRDQTGIRILDRAASQPRQPGSSIKPIATYTAALDNGYSLATGIDDVPFMRNEDGEIWPENVYQYYKGIVSLRDSIKDSINTNAVRTLKDIGIDKSMEYLRNFGLINEDGNDNFVTKSENSATNDENLAALGLGAMTNGMTVLDMTAAYASLANSGEYIEPLTFSKIQDAKDKIIFNSSKLTKNKVTSPETAYQMTSALQTTAESYGTIYLNNGSEFAAKTGTSEYNTDFWCLGYTPEYTIGVWMGADNQNLSLDDYSYQRSAVFWNLVGNQISNDTEAESFVEPEGIIHKKVDTISGKLPTQASYADPRGTVKEEIFSKSNVPTEDDDVHVWLTIDTRNNLLASTKTPIKLQQSRAFLDRKGSYDPSKWDGIVPEDWIYNPPTSYSNLGNDKSDSSSNDKSEEKDNKDKDKDNDKNTDNEDHHDDTDDKNNDGN